LLCFHLSFTDASKRISDQPITATNFDFTAWNNLIQQYVVPGVMDGISLNMVDYYKISIDPDYINIMTQLENANTTGFSWSQFHAFWINAYNFAVVRAVIEHPCKSDMFPTGCGPITSIRQCGVQQPSATVIIWKQVVTTVAGEEMSIENIISKLHEPPAPWKVDPRYHSALSAASISAPDLWVAFGYPHADMLDTQLNQSMQAWLSNPKKGSLFNIATKQLAVSPTIKWDLVDWTANGKTVWWWLHNYGTHLMKAYEAEPIISYLSFDWNLNGEVGKLCPYSNRPCYPWWGLLVTILVGFALFLLIVVYCCCTRAIKKKAFRDFLASNQAVPNEYEPINSGV
jgi:hypothetical protein